MLCKQIIESTSDTVGVECKCGTIRILGGLRFIRVLRGNGKIKHLVEYREVVDAEELGDSDE